VDIKGFFDNIDHELMMGLLKRHTEEKWILLYVERWLKANVQLTDGTLLEREKGSPQGSVISPILSNIFLHHVFDSWMAAENPDLPFERFADDLIVHCRTLEQARELAFGIAERLAEWKLEINSEKTRIVYCKDSGRPGNHEHISFTFLGFTFKPRRARNRQTGEIFTSFLPAISHKAQLTIFESIRKWKLRTRTNAPLKEIARDVNPQIRGWLNYYSKFYASALDPLRGHLDSRLMQWGLRKYKSLKKSNKCARKWLEGIKARHPRMFAHWRTTRLAEG
jgi:group II intron reverse transcriptase/maturase